MSSKIDLHSVDTESQAYLNVKKYFPYVAPNTRQFFKILKREIERSQLEPTRGDNIENYFIDNYQVVDV